MLVKEKDQVVYQTKGVWIGLDHNFVVFNAFFEPYPL